jgi:hypothetical protein
MNPQTAIALGAKAQIMVKRRCGLGSDRLSILPIR